MLKSVQHPTQPSTVSGPNRSASTQATGSPQQRPRRSLGAFSQGQLRSARETANRTRHDETPRLPPLSFGEPLSLDQIVARPPITGTSASTNGAALAAPDVIEPADARSLPSPSSQSSPPSSPPPSRP
ncbi:hypothetical protein ISG25_21160, partial [Burkholderia pseudomallei]|nr:hypothetical protein [Burkholderia pseudomallei]MBF3850386.1 hypothetical protein [Burkholderia pseudomallei]